MKKNILLTIPALGILLLITLAGTGCTGAKLNPKQKKAEESTVKTNEAVYSLLDFNNRQEFDFALQGLIAVPEGLEIFDENGKLVWSQNTTAFAENASAPDTANPSLWRNTQLNYIHGLFEVTSGIYQVRGYDMANITLIEGSTGWIVFDPVMNVETARAAMKLVNSTLGERPITGIVISHPHVDHYGGIRGIVSEEEVRRQNIPIIVPEGFVEHAVSENVYAGPAMARRAAYQYGVMLESGEKGRLAIGIGMGQPLGTVSFLAPNDFITRTGERRFVDGIEMMFQMTPGTEAQANMNTWFPSKNALWLAENCTGTLHNLYTLRGAQVRDGNAWARFIMETITLYGDDAQVVFQSHNWPRWGNDVIHEYLINTAAIYKFIHDQTLMYINQGYTSSEIAAMIRLPEQLEKIWYTRQYYGTLAHNVRAVYQRYMGWYDGNPVNLNPLPPVERAKKMIEYMGGADSVLKRARKDFAKGEYQWAAEITNAIVFADPNNKEARYLCADALEQLAYQAESGIWRNVYLSGALELRKGMSMNEANTVTQNNDIIRSVEPYMLLDLMGILLDTAEAQHINMKINYAFTNAASYLATVRCGILLYQRDARAPDADATVALPKEAMFMMLSKDGILAGIERGYIQVEGDLQALLTMAEYMVSPAVNFNIIEP